ncbi:hypothetical protein EON63_06635, partial [archaeon]
MYICVTFVCVGTVCVSICICVECGRIMCVHVYVLAYVWVQYVDCSALVFIPFIYPIRLQNSCVQLLYGRKVRGEDLLKIFWESHDP